MTLEETIAKIEALIPKENLASRGPRNLPTPSKRKKRRRAQRAGRRAARS